jgi:hypothetical protein
MKYPLVRVTWNDAADPDGSTPWHSDQDVEEFGASTCEVISVGWLRQDTKLYTTLVADYIQDEDESVTWGRPTKIPKGMITKMEVLVSQEGEEVGDAK